MNTKTSKRPEVVLAEANCACISDIKSVNFKPHPFVIGHKHVAYASDHCFGMLGVEVCEKIPCAECGRPYHEHTHDRVAFVYLKRNVSQNELQAWLKSLFDTVIPESQCDGIALIDTGFRVYP